MIQGLGDLVVTRCASCDYAITSRRYAVPRDCPICRQPLDPELTRHLKEDEEVTQETSSVFASKTVAPPPRSRPRPAYAATPLPFTTPIAAAAQVQPMYASQSRGAFEAGVAPKVLSRYGDGYRKARETAALGRLIKFSGALPASLVGLCAFFAADASGRGPFGGLVGLLLALFFGSTTFALFYVLGVVVSSLGRLRESALDSAVNSSPFLTNEQRAEVMSLRR